VPHGGSRHRAPSRRVPLIKYPIIALRSPVLIVAWPAQWLREHKIPSDNRAATATADCAPSRECDALPVAPQAADRRARSAHIATAAPEVREPHPREECPGDRQVARAQAGQLRTIFQATSSAVGAAPHGSPPVFPMSRQPRPAGLVKRSG